MFYKKFEQIYFQGLEKYFSAVKIHEYKATIVYQ